jgi:hypothetical protein
MLGAIVGDIVGSIYEFDNYFKYVGNIYVRSYGRRFSGKVQSCTLDTPR